MKSFIQWKKKILSYAFMTSCFVTSGLSGCPSYPAEPIPSAPCFSVDGAPCNNVASTPPFWMPPFFTTLPTSFTVSTAISDPTSQLTIPAPGVMFAANWQSDAPGAYGTLLNVLGVTDSFGTYSVRGGRVPGDWNFEWVTGGGVGEVCDTQSSLRRVLKNDIVFMYCFVTVDVEGATGQALMNTSSVEGTPAPDPGPIYITSPHISDASNDDGTANPWYY